MTQPPLWPPMQPVDWLFVAINCAIVFGILGPRLLRDIQGWLAPRKP